MTITLVIFTSGLAFAQFVSDGDATFGAAVTTGGTPGVITPFSASLVNISGGGATSVTWTGVDAGDDWVSANQYINVNGFETRSTWGIQIYTDNENGPTPATTYTGAGDPAGLVNASNTDVAIPMCWRVVSDDTFTAGSIDLDIIQQYIATDDIYVLLRDPLEYISDTNYFAPWFWMLDKETPDVSPTVADNQPFGDYQGYASLVGSSGVQIAPDTYVGIASSTSDYNVYLGAKFTTAAAGVVYNTGTLTVEMYHL